MAGLPGCVHSPLADYTAGRFGSAAFVCALRKQMSGAALHLGDYLFFITFFFFFKESELKESSKQQ